MKIKRTQFFQLAYIFLLAFVQTSVASNEVRISIKPSQIVMGTNATLTVEVQSDTGSTDSTRPEIPNTSGLSFYSAGTSSNFVSNNVFSNGKFSKSVSYTTTYSFIVTPDKPGDYEIGPISVEMGGKKKLTRKIKLKVLKSAAGGNLAIPQMQSQGRGSRQGSSLTQNNNYNSNLSGASAKVAFMRFNLSRRLFYLGEKIPVKVQAYFRENLTATIKDLTLNSDAFVIDKQEVRKDKFTNQLDKEFETVNGTRYKKVTWDVVLSPIKTGDFELNFNMPSTLYFPDSGGRTRSPFNDPFFNDPFFDNFFGMRTRSQRQEKVNLFSNVAKVKVSNLPDDDKPADFSGAIGNFRIINSDMPSSLNVGEPGKIIIQVEGQGDFDKLEGFQIKNPDGWKLYDSESEFSQSGKMGLSGVKKFELPIIPQVESAETPQLSLSYFDPELGKYRTLEPKLSPVKILSNNANPHNSNFNNANANSGSSTKTTKENSNAENNPQNSIAINKQNKIDGNASNKNSRGQGGFFPILEVAMSNPEQSLAPVTLQRPFIISVLILSASIVVLVIYNRATASGRSGKVYENAKRTKRAIDKEIRAMEHAISADEAHSFFAHGKSAIQHKLASIIERRPEAITGQDVQTICGEESELRKIFDLADAVSYSGKKISSKQLNEWKQKLVKEINQIK